MSHLRQVRNYKRIVAPITYMVSSEDDVIDVDTTGGLATIYIPNIQADATIDRKIYINDATNNAGTNPITIVTIGGNTINNVSSLPLDVNGISAQILIVDRNRYLANLNTDSGSGGGGDKNYVYQQFLPAMVWNVPHNLNKKCSVQITDSSNVAIDAQIEWVDNNNVKITLSEPVTGFVYCN